MNYTMITDLYEFTMGEKNFQDGTIHQKQYYDITFRSCPFGSGYVIAAGLDRVIEHVKNLTFEETDIAYLKSLNLFSEGFLDYLKEFHFTGDIYAVPDGTPVFPHEPLVTVHAPAFEAKLLESALLSYYNHGGLVATKTRRIVETAGVPVMEFGLRRGLSPESALYGSRYAYMAGCSGTSNTMDGLLFGIPAKGTTAHSSVMESQDEYTAFLDYAKALPNNCIFLVDTYDTLRSGIPNAIKVAKEFLIPNGYEFKGIRIDSGDLAYLSKEARKMLDEAGFPNATICLSNGLEETAIINLKEQGAVFDSLGVGDNIIQPLDRLGCIYKLAAQEEGDRIVPKMKHSNQLAKATLPGVKKVYRFYDTETGYALGDVIALKGEEISKKQYTFVDHLAPWKQKTVKNYELKALQVPIFKQGTLVYQSPTLEQSRNYCEEEMSRLYPEVRRIRNPASYIADLSEELRTLRDRLLYQNQMHCAEITATYEKQYVKHRKGVSHEN